jgi:hypothetical protein
MAIKGSGQITITDITDAYNAQLTSENFSFTANGDTAAAGSVAITGVSVVRGSVKLEPKASSATLGNDEFKISSITFKNGSSTLSSSTTPKAPSYTVVQDSTNKLNNITVTLADGGSSVTIDAYIIIDIKDVTGTSVQLTKVFTMSVTKKGTAGAAGAKWHQGSGAPSSSTGSNGDYYLNTSNGDVYTKSNGSWSSSGNIEGTAGTNGLKTTIGTALSGTSGNISGAAGTAGDQYINSSTFNLYKCVTTGTESTAVWNYVGNIKGAPGAAGADAISVVVTGDQILKNNTGSTTLTAHVYKGGVAATIASNGAATINSTSIGTVKWYKGETTASQPSGYPKSANQISVSASEVGSVQSFTCTLEA